MRKQMTIKTLALLLVLSLCMSILPSSVFAVSESKTANDTAPTLEDFLAGNATAEDIYGVLDESTVPEIIGYEEAVRKNHVRRLYEDEGEELNKVVFLNVDGSKTMYTFDFPVKYIDDDGNIRDITLEITDSTTQSGEFESAANSAITTFSAQFTDGITLTGSDAEIRLVPVLPSVGSGTATMYSSSILDSSATPVSEAQRVDENTIEYRYDGVTTVEYSLTYTGFKEDIVVSEYTGQTEYPFRLYTNGLALEEIDGSYFLVDDYGDIQATIGDIIIFTADERNNTFGSIVPMTVVENEEYLLTIVVDANYLADPNTAYPIRIDPTVEINYDDSGSSAIEDITISTNTNFTGSHTSLYVGRRSTEGIARALMRFPGLDLTGLEGATVTSASVRVRDLMCEDTPLDISCHVFTGNVWDASSATWDNVSPNSYVSTALSTNTLSWSIGDTFDPIHWYYFDITSAVQGWIDGNYTQSKGIIFKASNTVENGSTIANRTFGSYNRASYKPSLSVTYEPKGTQVIANGTYYLNNRGTGKYVQKTTSGTSAGVSGLLSSIRSTVQWEIQKVSNGYVIRSASDPTKYLAGSATTTSSSVSIVTVSDSALPARCVWTFTGATNGGYLIKNSYSSRYLYSSKGYLYTDSSTGTYGTTTYETRVWRLASTSNYGNTSSYSSRELSTSTSISNMEIAKNGTRYVTINKYYSNELWATRTDFEYSFSKSDVVSNVNGKITAGATPGGVKVTATHKVTGLTKNFYIVVGYSSSIAATPFPATITEGLNKPYSVWPAGSESAYYYYSDADRTAGLVGIYAEAVAGVTATKLIYPAASDLLNHYLGNKGTRYTIDFKSMIDECEYSQTQRATQMNQLMRAVEASATYSSKTLKVMEAYKNSIPSDSKNWYLAIGQYYTSVSCSYKKTASTTYTMTVTYELHDCYDWERTTVMTFIDLLSSQMWELHYGGYAKNYEVYGKNTFTVSWTEGQSFSEELITNET